MASTQALDKRLTALESVVSGFTDAMAEIIRSAETATRAYAENEEPFRRQVATIRQEIRARFDGLDERLRKLEGGAE